MLAAETLEPLRTAAAAAVDKKAFHVDGLEVTDVTSFTDAFLICSAGSPRQVDAVAGEIGRRLAAEGRRPLHVEGTSTSEWVLLDYGDFVVHVFTEEKRSYYGLEGLWGDAPLVTAETLGIGGPQEGRG